MVEQIMENFASFLRSGSGWVFEEVISLKLYVVENRASWEGQAGSWIPLRTGLAKKNNRNGLINIQNKDDHNCFQYCVKRVEYQKKRKSTNS